MGNVMTRSFIEIVVPVANIHIKKIPSSTDNSIQIKVGFIYQIGKVLIISGTKTMGKMHLIQYKCKFFQSFCMAS